MAFWSHTDRQGFIMVREPKNYLIHVTHEWSTVEWDAMEAQLRAAGYEFNVVAFTNNNKRGVVLATKRGA